MHRSLKLSFTTLFSHFRLPIKVLIFKSSYSRDDPEMSFPITQAQPFTLIIYSSPLFPAHWSLFMPSSNQSVGTRIHVTGSSHSGFTHEFVRSYDLSTDTRSYKLVPLPDINFEFVSREKEETEIKGGEGGESVDVLPRNELERLALEVSAPGKSLKSLNENRKVSRYILFHSL